MPDLEERMGIFTARSPIFNLFFKWEAVTTFSSFFMTDVHNAIRSDADKTMENYVRQMLKEAKSNCPENEGDLRKSIYMKRKEPLKYELGASEDYAKFVEYGIFGRGQVRLENRSVTGAEAEAGAEISKDSFHQYAFLRPAIKKYEEGLREELEDEIGANLEIS